MDVLVSDVMLELWSVLGALLATLLLVAGTLWASARVINQGRAVWGALRGHVPDVLAAVDDPGDAVNRRLARATRVPPAVWAAFLPAFVSALAEGLDRALAEDETAAPAPGEGAQPDG